MHVLHYIDHVRNEDFLSQYLTILTSTQEQLGAKVSVVTLHDNIEEKIDKLHPQMACRTGCTTCEKAQLWNTDYTPWPVGCIPL